VTDATLRRVRRWHDALPEDARPHWDDVEVVVRLGVTTTAAAQRLLWNDPGALAKRFDALQAVIRGQDSASVDNDDSTGPDEESARYTEPATSLHAGPSGVDAPQKQARVLAWLETLRLEGVKVDLSPDAVEQVTRASSLAQLRGLLPRELLRRRGDELGKILGIGGQGSDRGGLAAPNRRQEDGAVAAPSEGRLHSDGGSPSGPAVPDGFALFNNWSSTAQVDVRFSASAGEGIGLSWEAPADRAGVHIYRVTARDDYEPASPDESRLIATTYDTAAIDTAVFTTAKRHVAVWLHRGADERSARASQAELWALGTCVLPVRDMRITVVDGQVAGTWTVADGVDRVEVLCVPEAEAVTDHYNLRYRIGDQPGGNLLGFEDHREPGNWVYRIYACASHNGQPLRSPMVEQAVTVAAILPRVSDLQVTVDPGAPDLFTLSWAKPALHDASVEIHRHRQPLQAGIDSRVLDREAMNRYGLTEEDTRVNQRAIERDGRMVMERVRWPAGTPRIHFTAVTRSRDGSQFQIGDTQTRNRAGEVTHALLVERVDEQFVTFAWPEGADFVQIYQGARHAEVNDVSSLACVVELSQEKYERLGGARLPYPLPSSGCSLHLVGVSFQQGRPSRGPVCSLDYPGLARIEYRLDRNAPEPVKRRLLGRKTSVPHGPVPPSLSVRCDRDLESMNLALVHHRTRLPLYPGEGEKILEGPVSLRADQATTLKAQLPELLGRGGFVRLFVIVPDADLDLFAVLDPPVQQLRCD